MKNNKLIEGVLHAILLTLAFLTLIPFFFVLNNSVRTNAEIDRDPFGPPAAIGRLFTFTAAELSGNREAIQIRRLDGIDMATAETMADIPYEQVTWGEGMSAQWRIISEGYITAWDELLNRYTWNSLIVVFFVVIGVIVLGSTAAYIFSRYEFPGNKLLFYLILSMMMIPAVLTLVPSYLVVRALGLLNTYWVMILPAIAGGQVMAIFLFKGFFDGLPEDLFESARLDGAGHLAIYLNIVLPLSKPIVSVIAILTSIGVWNGFLWPFITLNDADFYPITAGLYNMAMSPIAANFSTMLAGYVVASIPLLLLFVFATRTFISGVTSGAFKA